MIKYLREIIFEVKYAKNIFSILVNPFHIHRYLLNKSLNQIASELNKDEIILDIGCGEMPYKNNFRSVKYIGLDILVSGRAQTRKKPSVWFDGRIIPFSNDSCSIVLMTEVIEHIHNPKELFTNINRVLSPNGKLIFTVPYFWPIHEPPYDFYRYTQYGLKNLLESNSFRVMRISCLSNKWSSFLQTLNTFIYYSSGKYLFIFFIPIFFLINLLASVTFFYESKNNPFTLGYICEAKKC